MEKVSKERKERVMEKVRKAGDPENYETEWDEEGRFKSKEKVKVKRGRASKGAGARFELRVRRDLEEKGRIVDKWSNNVDAKEWKLIIARKIFNPFKKFMVPSAGFPDFISIKQIHDWAYSVIGVEVKMNGNLSKIEKQKCAWYLQNKVFSEIWIARKGEKRGVVEYDDFSEKYGEKYNN